MTTPVIPLIAQVVIDRAEKDGADILEAISGSTIDNDEDYAAAIDVLKVVKGLSNELESTRTSITQPINANLREINKLFGGPQARLDIIEKRLKSLTASYAARKQAEQQALLAEAAKAAQRGGASDEARAIIQQATTSAAPAVAGISHTERWTWNTVDISLVPREYLCVDDAKVSAAVRAGERNIPGIRIFPMTQTRVVAGK